MSLLLLSGGTDSACLASLIRPLLCLTVDYGQKIAKAEIEASKNICRHLKLKHEVIQFNLRDFATGTMAGEVQSHFGALPEWWPYRNQLLITVGAMVAFKRKLGDVVIGTVRSDRRHKDGSLSFLRRMDTLLKNQEGEVRLLAPARRMSAEELAATAKATLSLLGLTFSCHRSNFPCGQCRGCRKNEAVISSIILSNKRRRLASSAGLRG